MGLAHSARRLGRPLRQPCPRCGARQSKGLTIEELYELVFQFFVRGTYFHGLGGYAPILITPGTQVRDPQLPFREKTQRDWSLISSLIPVCLNYNAPPLWRLGYTNHWEVDDSGEEIQWRLTEDGVRQAINAALVREIPIDYELYRARLNLKSEGPIADYEFDTPPEWLAREFGRFDSRGVPIFYAGRNVDVCLHEMRLSNRDTITLATCRTNRTLRLLDITGEDCFRGETPFDDPLHFFNGLVFSNDRLEECRLLAKCIREAGFDGFIYQSYHSPVMPSPGHNVALFGWPIREGKVRVVSVNNVFLEEIRVKYQLGPVL